MILHARPPSLALIQVNKWGLPSILAVPLKPAPIRIFFGLRIQSKHEKEALKIKAGLAPSL
jgi:hypothetical protein